MSYSTILAEIKTELNAIIPTDTGNFATIGNVHDYVRVQDNDATRVTFLKSGALCPEWFLSLANREPDLSEVGTLEGRQYEFLLRGYYPVNDSIESEKLFLALIEDILNHFEYEDTLDHTVWTMRPPALTRFESVSIMLDGKYVHYCEIRFRPYQYAT